MVEAKAVHSFTHLNFKPTVSFTGVDCANSSDQDGVAFNGKMVALPWQSTSSIAVFNTEKPLNFNANIPLLKGHAGTIQDIAWSPFEERLLASCADDGMAKLWVFDDQEGTQNKEGTHRIEADMELEAHNRKCLSVQWHESCENLLATHSVDKTIKVWDIHEDRADDAIITFTDMADYCTQIRWSPDGKMIGGMARDKTGIMFDPRREDSVMKFTTHQGPRAQQINWIDDQTVIVAGFDRQAKRAYGIWDLRNSEAPIAAGQLNGGSGVPLSYYDREYKSYIVYGRGDNIITVYAINKSGTPMFKQIMEQSSGNLTQKHMGFAPKWCVNTGVQEIYRACRVNNNKTLDVLSVQLPSKTGSFVQEFYPPFTANEPANTAEAWCAGTDVAPKTMQMTQVKSAAKTKKTGLSRLKTGIKTAAAPEEAKGGEDSAALRAQVAQLQSQLAAAQASSSASPVTAEDMSTKPVLGYWDIRGLAAQIRYMFYYCGIDFEDKLYSCGDAPDFDKSCWIDEKFNLGMEYPNLPYLIDGEAKVTETVAIMQYIAKKYRPALLGNSAAEIGRISMLLDKVHTLKMKSTGACYMAGDSEAIIEECRPLLAAIVQAIGDGDWIAGANLTWLDFYFAELLDLLDKVSDGLFYAEFPTMQAYWDRFVVLPGFAEAWADDSKTMKAPFNNKMAKLLNC